MFDLLRAEDRPLRILWIQEMLGVSYHAVVRTLTRLRDFGAAVNLADGSWAADGCTAPTIWPAPYRDPASQTALGILEAARQGPLRRPDIETIAGESPTRWITALTQAAYLTGSAREGYRLTRAGARALGAWPEDVATPLANTPIHREARSATAKHPPDGTLSRAILETLKATGPMLERDLIADVQTLHPGVCVDGCAAMLRQLRHEGRIVLKWRVGLTGEWTFWGLTGTISKIDPDPTFELTLLLGEYGVDGALYLDRLDARFGPVRAQWLLDTLVKGGFAHPPEDTSGSGGAILLSDHARALAMDSKQARALGALRAFPGMTDGQLRLLDILLGYTPRYKGPTTALLESHLVRRLEDGRHVAEIPNEEGEEPPPDPDPLVTRDLLQAFAPENLRYSTWLLNATPRDGSAARFRDIAERCPNAFKLWRLTRRLAEHDLVEVRVDRDQGAFIARNEPLTRRHLGRLLGRPAPARRQLDLDDLYTLLLIEQMPSAPPDDLMHAGLFINRETGRATSLRRLERRGYAAPAGKGFIATQRGQAVSATIAPALGRGGVQSAARTISTPD